LVNENGPAATLAGLTPLRFVAAALIVMGHGATGLGFELGPVLPYAINSMVCFFFVLSGFILRYNYPLLADSAGVAGFYVRRFARIWPLHAATMLLMFALLPYAQWTQTGINPWLALALSGSLLQSWVPVGGYMGAFNGPAWTLSVDVFFYALFPWLLVRMRDAPARTLAGTFLLSILGPLFANIFGGPRSDAPLDQWNPYLLEHAFPLARLVEFALGMAVAGWWSAHRQRLRFGRVAGTALEIAALALTVVAASQLPRTPYLSPLVGRGGADWLTQVAMAPVYALLIAVIASDRGFVARFLALPACTHFGELSFAVYMLHAPLLKAANWAAYAAEYGSLATTLAFWVLLLLLSHCVWKYFEVPARRRIMARWREREGVVPAPVGT
jgi:peptidoglycan/LPS O-acetylase OafA/YrhL